METKLEKIGDTIFPVTYGDNGLVLVDYPDLTLNRKFSAEELEELDKFNKMLDSMRNKYNISINNITYGNKI